MRTISPPVLAMLNRSARCLSAAAASSSFLAAAAAWVSNASLLTVTTSPRLGSRPAAAVTSLVTSASLTLPATSWSRTTATVILLTWPGALVVEVLSVPTALVRLSDCLT